MSATYMKVAGVKGFSRGGPDRIDFQSFSWGASGNVNASGMPQGKIHLEPLHIVKKADGSTPLFSTALVTHDVLKLEMHFERDTTGGKAETFFKMKLEDVLVAQQQVGNEPGEALPTERLTFTYTKLYIEHCPETNQTDGSFTGATCADLEVAKE